MGKYSYKTVCLTDLDNKSYNELIDLSHDIGMTKSGYRSKQEAKRVIESFISNRDILDTVGKLLNKKD
jgi:hypothetical protein